MAEITIPFTPPHPLNTAVLFLVFNRLDTTKLVFEAIRHAKPPRLYIAADGARENREGEDAKVKAVREYVMSNIDWECDVKTLFREENFGCKHAVSGAITWFFENEEMGIILEDDCLPSQSFFWFCEELLDKYKDDMRVWQIGGTTFKNIKSIDGEDYYFSKYTHIWGWASWASRWKYYDVKMQTLSKFKRNNYIKNIFENKEEQAFWIEIFTKIAQSKIDTWDYQWVYTMNINHGLCALPTLNLISNIGFGLDATHTNQKIDGVSELDQYEISFPLKVREFIFVNAEIDNYISNRNFLKKSFFEKIKNQILKVFR